MKRTIITILLLNAAYCSCACDCIMFPIDSYIKKVDYIFTGKVIEVLDSIDFEDIIDTPNNRAYMKDRGYRVRVVIIEKIKTKQLKYDTLEFTSDFSGCDPVYKLNESYLFFADKTKSGKFKMVHCTYWGPLEESKDKIKKLKSKLKK